MTIDQALQSSTGYFSCDGYVGYLGLAAANVLVESGEYKFHRMDCWGFIVRKIAA